MEHVCVVDDRLFAVGAGELLEFIEVGVSEGHWVRRATVPIGVNAVFPASDFSDFDFFGRDAFADQQSVESTFT